MKAPILWACCCPLTAACQIAVPPFGGAEPGADAGNGVGQVCVTPKAVAAVGPLFFGAGKFRRPATDAGAVMRAARGGLPLRRYA